MNNQIFFFFYNLSHKYVFFDQLVIFTAEIFPYAVIILAGLFLLFHHEVLKAESPFQVLLEKKKEFLALCFSSGVAWVFPTILKILFYTPRPFVVFPEVHPLFIQATYAFPSGHASVFSAIAFTLFFTHKKAGYIFMFFALVIGIARIIAGVHFPIDILGGFLLGGIVSYLVALFVKNV